MKTTQNQTTRFTRFGQVLVLLAAILVGGVVVPPAAQAATIVTGTIAVGLSPTGLVVSPDGSRLYVAIAGDGKVKVINTATNLVIETITVGAVPQGVAISPDGTRLYVTNTGSGTVSVINTETYAIEATILVGNQPIGIAVSPTAARLYVSNSGDDTVSEIDTGSNTLSHLIPVGDGPYGVAVSRSGLLLYVANKFSGNLSMFTTADRLPTERSPLFFGGSPQGIAASPAGDFAYLTLYSAESLIEIDMGNRGGGTSGFARVGFDHSGVAVSPDGMRVYATNSVLNTLTIVDPVTKAVSATVGVGRGPSGVATSSVGGRIYVSNTTDGTVSVLEPEVAPINTAVPVITGTALNGQTLSATPGTWTGLPTPTVTLQWQSCTTANCVGGTVANVGTDAASYELTSAEAGKYMRVQATGSNGVSPNGVAYSTITSVVGDVQNGFTYSVTAGAATITAYDPAGAGAPGAVNLTIPATLGGATTSIIDTSVFAGKSLTGALTLPDGLSNIAANAFMDNPGLTSVVWGTSQANSQLTSIGANAFRGTGLAGSLALPNSLGAIGQYAFYNLSSIASVSFGSSQSASQLESIATSAFGGTGLTGALRLPDSLLTVGDYVFLGLTGVTSVSFGSSQTTARLTSIGTYAFSRTGLMGTLRLPDSVRTVGVGAFFDVGTGSPKRGPELSLSSGIAASSLWQVGADAFNYSAPNTSLVIPDSVTQMLYDSFRGFAQLESLTFGGGTSVIGDSAFRSAPLTSILFTGNEAPTTIESWAFTNGSGRVLTRWQGATGWTETRVIGTIPWPVVIAAPTVTSISPASGVVMGNQPVRIFGTGFATGATVSIGGVATEVNVVSSREITARTPDAGGGGTVGVTVSNPVVLAPVGTGEALSGSLNSAYTFLIPGPMTFTSGAFPSVVVGSTSALTVTVRNTGGAPTLPVASVTGGGVAVTGGTCATVSFIGAGETCTVILGWSPSAGGNLTGSVLRITYPYGDVPNNALTLTGNASAAPSPGGGGASPTPESNETSTPVASSSAVPVPTELKPGVGSLMIDGVATPVTVVPSPDGKELVVSGGGVRVVLNAVGPDGKALPLARDGSLVLSQSGGLPMAGSGFSAGSMVTLFMFSTPVTLGSATANAAGGYAADVVIPAATATGSHTIQVIGTTASGQPIALSVGVTVKTAVAARGSNPMLIVTRTQSAGSKFVVEARGVQASCNVKFWVKGSTVNTQSGAAGKARATLKAPTTKGNWTVSARVTGKQCDPVSINTPIRVITR